MARPNIFAYFDDSAAAPRNQRDLLRLWVRSWESHGWNPRILTVVNAQAHPAFSAFQHDPGEYPRLASESAKVHLCDMALLNFSYRPIGRKSVFKIIVVPYLEEGWETAPLVSFSGIHSVSVIENCGRALC